MANLVELFDNIVQMENLNGVPLANGKMYVYALGRTRLMDTWTDVDGESLNSNPIILDAAGQCHCYVSDDFDYTLVVTDAYDNEIFSIDKYLYSQGSHSHADVAVAPSETIAVSSYHVGETTVYVPYLTGQLGKVYTGIDPIVVNNTEDKISANHVPLGVQDPLYFVQDDEEGCIIGIDSSACGKTYSGISPILVDNTANTISITGDIGKDWTEEILSAANDASAAATAWTNSQGYLTGVDLSEYAKESFVISAIDSSTSGLLPTSAFATASGSFITALPADLATTGFVADVSADITAMIPTALTGDYLTKESADTLYAPTGNYLTGLPDDLATTGWVDSQGYLTAVDIPESANWNSTYNTVHDNSASWTGGTANPQIPVTSTSGISIFESGDKVYFNISADYAFADDITGKQDTLAFGYHDTAISSIDNSALYDNSAHARINTLAGRISDLSSNKLDTTAFSDVSGTFLTDDNTVVLEYGTSTWAEFKAAYDAHKNIVMYQRDIGDITNTYATFGYVDFDGEPYAAAFTTVCYGTEYRFTLNSNNVWQSYTQMYQARGNYYSASNPNGFVTSGELPTIGVQEGETLDTDYDGLKIVKSTANGNEHINLHKKSTDQWLIHGNLVPTSPGSNKYLVTDDSGAMHWDNKSALAYDSAFEQSGGYITAYNGSAFKAGDELPSGVMVESGLEYNAVNEISAYNGSAIAQYGAEKQWLQHDDTIVHVANSAQYAFGCNISALQRLMGIDETVLFFAGNESSGVQSGNLTESIKNFKRIRVAGMDNDGHTDVKYIYPAWTKNADGFSTSGYEVVLYGATPFAPQSTIWEKWTTYSFSALTSFKVVLSYEGSHTANSVNNVTNNHKNSIREVVGIGRISG